MSEEATVGVSAPLGTPAEALALDRVRARMLGTANAAPTFGRYALIEEIGSGAMGRVLRAYDPKLQREVALKEVRHDALDAESTARLVAEARAMAKLSHANVVAVYDAEELEGEQVVLVMEYVAGKTLGAWLRGDTLDWTAIVELFIPAGRGLAAAHAANLLHRDFKPDNVLVSEHGVVKVTDFGLAKGSGPGSEQTERSQHDSMSSGEVLTEAGMVVGTPRYMAPEQHRGDRLTAAADQYAFCVALWEALCGEPPFSGPSMGVDKASGPPAWPGGGVPRVITKAIERGLSPEPRDRWPSMDALLEALVWDPSRWRNRVILAAAGVGVLGVGGVSYDAWARAQAERCSGAAEQLAGIWDDARREAVRGAMSAVDRPYAADATARTLAALDAYATQWAEAHAESCEATTIRGEQSAEMMDVRMACLRRAAAELDATAEVLAEADDVVVGKAHVLTAGLPPLSRCADVEALTADIEPPLPQDEADVERARERLVRAKALLRAGRYADARGAVKQAKALAERIGYGPLLTDVFLREGTVLQALGEYDAAEEAFAASLRSGATWHQWEAMAMAVVDLMFLVGCMDKDVERALEHRAVAQGLVHGNPRAEATFRNNLAAVLDVKGEHAEAEREYRAAIELYRESYGPGHLSVAGARDNLGLVLEIQGRYAEAEAEHRAALEALEAALGPDHPGVAPTRSNLALALESQGKLAEAETELRRALEALELSLGSGHPRVAGTRGNLASVLHAQEKWDEAETEHRAAVAGLEATLGPGHPDVAGARISLAMVLGDRHADAQAEAELRTALRIFEEAHGEQHPDVALTRADLAAAMLAQGKASEALPLAEASWRWHQGDEVLGENRAYAAFVLARALWDAETPDRDRARELAEAALQGYREAGEVYANDVEDVEAWLAEHR